MHALRLTLRFLFTACIVSVTARANKRLLSLCSPLLHSKLRVAFLAPSRLVSHARPKLSGCNLALLQARISANSEEFMDWARNKGVESPGLDIAIFPGGIRGLRASESLASGRPLMTVPHRLVLETTTLSRVPPPSLKDSVDLKVWGESPWYVRLSLMLLHEKQLGSTSSRVPWLHVLPTFEQFCECLPLHWEPEELEQLQYKPILEAIEKQRIEYEGYYNLCGAASGATYDEFIWALHCVRSRSFSGAYEGSVWEERAIQAGFTVVLAIGALLTGASDPGSILNGILAVGVTTVMRDFLVSNRGGLKRYVLCPAIDMFNHCSSYAADVSYEYFSNSFTAKASRPFEDGDEVCISYGKRSNDQLLQLYGFSEEDNPSDQYEIRHLLENIDTVLPGGIPAGRVTLLEDANLLSEVRVGTATADGFVDATRLAVRALVATEDEILKAGGGSLGCAALANGPGDKARLTGSNALDDRVDATLADVCALELESFPTSFQDDIAILKRSNENPVTTKIKLESSSSISDRLSWRAKSALRFRIEKKRVLKNCILALRKKL